MKIGLISPSRSQKRSYSSSHPPLKEFFDTNPFLPSLVVPNLSLLSIAGCTPRDYDLRLIDERFGPVDFDEPFDIVGISIMTEQAGRGYAIADEFRKRGVFTVIGGIHASLLPDEAKTHCDSVVVGEGDRSWPVLLAEYQGGTAHPFYRSSGPIEANRLPIPRYDLADPNVYPFFPVQTARGCRLDRPVKSLPQVSRSGLRSKTTTQILAELEVLCRVSLNRKVIFCDENIFIERARSRELLKAITPLRIKYFAAADVSLAADERLLEALIQSGCIAVFINFANPDPDHPNAIREKTRGRRPAENNAAACARIQAHGIQVLGAFILGFDHDDPGVFRRTADFVLENNILGQFQILTPFPGTRLRQELFAEGRLPHDDDPWDLYSGFDAVIAPKAMSKEDLSDGLLDIYRNVYTKDASMKRSRHMVGMFQNLRPHWATVRPRF
jgi:radical SAM superfamily enzyme YgiQ (UPF0313 family)